MGLDFNKNYNAKKLQPYREIIANKWWLNQKNQEQMKRLEKRLPSAITLMKGT
jgi:hypothetical protein